MSENSENLEKAARDTVESLAEQLKMWRAAVRKMTLEELADEMGIDPGRLLRMEKGDPATQIGDWARIWERMGTRDDLLYGASPKEEIAEALFDEMEKHYALPES